MSYVDAHVHVWTDDLETYPLAAGTDPGRLIVTHFRPEELLAHARPAGVDRIVLVQLSHYGWDNRYMLDAIAARPDTFRGIAAVDPDAESPDAAMRELARRGVRGFRITLGGRSANAWLEGPGYEPMFRAASDGNLTLCPLINPEALPALAAQCRRFPDAPVVIDHMCRIGADGDVRPADVEALCRLAAHPHVMVKLSAFYALGGKKPPYTDLADLIRRLHEAFGPERLMWASDSPYQVQGEHTYAASLELVRDRLDFLSDADREQLLNGTAQRVFFSD